MSGLLPLLSFLLVAAAGGGTDAKLTGVLEANSETAAAYWQAALPGSPIPLAVLDLFTPADDKIEVNIESINAAKNESTQKSTVEDPHISRPRKLGMHSPVEKKTRTKEVELLKRPYNDQRKNHKFPYNYGLDGERDDQKTKKFSYNYDPHQAGNDLSIQKFPYNYGPHQVGNNEKTQQFLYNYGPHQIGNNKKTQELPYNYGLHQAGNDEKTPEFLYNYGPQQTQNDEKIQEFPYNYGIHQAGNDEKTPEFLYNYGPQQTQNDEKTQEFPYIYGLHQAGNDEKTPEFLYNYGPQQTENDEKTQEFPYHYGPHQAGNDEKTRQYPYNYGPHQRGEDEKTQQFPYNYGPHQGGNNKKTQQFPYNYGPHHMGNDENTKKFPYNYGPHQSGNDEKIQEFPYNYGPHQSGNDEQIQEFPYNYGPHQSGNDEKIQEFPYHYGPHQSGNDEKIQKFPYHNGPPQMGNDMKTEMFPYNYGPHQTKNGDKIQKFPYNYGAHTKFGERHAHVHYHGHGNGHGDAADIFFSEDILTQGSLVTPYIQPTTSRPVLLRRDVADSIPFSTKRFADVVAMFAPASLAMADDIRLTLDVCEHPRPIEGEKITCATSLESLVEFPVSELGTQDVRAFSADVPRKGTASWRYNITALRVVTDSSTKIATCHDMAYPYAVFYCHTVHTDSPTRTYMVTLASEDGGDSAAPAPAMEALAVCHLNTSKWDPNHPFFVKRHVKPGDTTVCHFLTRGSFLWAPAANTSGVVEQVAAQ